MQHCCQLIRRDKEHSMISEEFALKVAEIGFDKERLVPLKEGRER